MKKFKLFMHFSKIRFYWIFFFLYISVTYAADITVPAQSDWINRGIVLTAGPPGSWDVRLHGMISPCTVIKKNGTFFLYYIGADGNRTYDMGPRHRALGVATSTDGINFTKYSGNPIITFLPHYNEEEGVFSAGATLDDNGNIVLFYGAMDAGSSSSTEVSSDVRLATSSDGYNFSDKGIVLSHSDGSVWGSGDELFPLGIIHHNGNWFLYYTTDGWNLGIAWGLSPKNFIDTQGIPNLGSEIIIGGGDPFWFNSNKIGIFLLRGEEGSEYIEVRSASINTPTQLSSPIETYVFKGYRHMTTFLDVETNTWFMFHKDPGGYDSGNTIIVRTAPVNGGDTTPPSKPTELNAQPVNNSQVDLIWNKSIDPESGISHYIIYRDDIFAEQSSDTSYSDIGLSENTLYTYEVSAVNGVGLESEKSDPTTATTLPDLVAPTIISILTNGGPTQVKVVYSETVEEFSATHMANYSIDNGILITFASLSSDFKTVTLTISPHSVGITYTLTVNNVYDRASIPNIILPNTQISYTYSPKLIISNLTVSSGKNYVVIDSLSDGAVAYIDRTYTYNDVPDFLEDKSYIKTANDDKFSQEVQFLSFEVNQSVKVYVAHDDLYEIKPDWLGNFTDTGEDLVIDGSPMSVFERSYSGGTVTLGGNVHPSQSDSNNMYTVIIEGSGLVTTSQGEPNRTYSFLLDQNYPNPFNSSTNITYQLASKGNVVLEIFDNLGKKIQTVVDTIQSAGVYEVHIDGRNLPSGIYLYRLRAGNFTKIRKMLLLR
jgi:hypothetical protein